NGDGAGRTAAPGIGRVLAVAGLVGLAAFLVTSRVSFDPSDPPTHLVYPANDPVRNLCGPVGAWAAYHLVRLLGFGSWLIIAAVTLYAALGLWGRRVSLPALRLVGVIMIAAAAGAFQAMLFPKSGPFPGLAGGVIGQSAWVELSERFGLVGTAVWLLLLAAVGGIVAFDRWLIAAPAWVAGAGMPAAKRAGSVAGVAAGAAGRLGGGLVSGLAPLMRGREPVRIRLNDVDDEFEAVAGTRKRRKRPVIVEEDEAETEAAAADAEAETDETPAPTRKRRGRK